MSEIGDIEANAKENPQNSPEVAEVADEGQEMAQVEEDMRSEVPRHVIAWLKDTIDEFEQELKLVKKCHEKIKKELTEIKESREELILEFEDAKNDHEELKSKMTDMEYRIENLQELMDTANGRLTAMETKIIENILEVEKQAEKTTGLLKELENIQHQVDGLEAEAIHGIN
ncbi:protein CIP2A homolog [Monodelphis domestica]|uniref:protein CIP2A homolog n=1 Tax=Monodelphis domestica TaxID=13616 RepID=UPI0007B40B1C|nr:protein CIP2A homolog [Monodelphis domestica]XP_056664855.1 protein CIP2A homolog [Monodelphis domestica]XP_056664856.1 protein CIP2A homolog [Monodelphis domestica]